jgi:hypothetical protein
MANTITFNQAIEFNENQREFNGDIPAQVKTDGISGADSITKQAGKFLIEGVELSEVFIIGINYICVLMEAVGLSDNIQRNMTKLLVETCAIADSITKSIVRLFSDGLHISAVALKKPVRTLSDAIQGFGKFLFWGHRGETADEWTNRADGSSVWTKLIQGITTWANRTDGSSTWNKRTGDTDDWQKR